MTATGETSPESTSEQKQENGGNEADAKKDSQTESDQDSQEDLATDSFMSFEEWKAMMLRKSGQDPADQKNGRKQQKENKESGGHGDLDGLGDDGEIALDFDALSDKVTELTASQSGDSAGQADVELREEKVLYDDGKAQYFRSKDAGKTCKERFSYSSFDAGATVLKTNPGAKNAKHILIENKDSYMLLECRTKNKFVIVELSEDILVDTVVLANFEFFSSMIRRFRVSVSDRYPVKLDKWVDLGTFEARNSRDIQAFLVEHPQIYTKYIRVEFLTHYGNEYYCPVSLLRVHGTRMIDSWKEPEVADDETIDAPPPQEAIAADEHVAETPVDVPQPPNVTQQESPDMRLAKNVDLSRWEPLFPVDPLSDTCQLGSRTISSRESSTSGGESQRSLPVDQKIEATMQSSTSHSSKTAEVSRTAAATETQSESSSVAGASTPVAASPPPSSARIQAANSTATQPSTKQASVKANTGETVVQSSSTKSSSSNGVSSAKNRTSTASAASSSPTVQESFFKTVTKRLQLLESNTSLSLQYIEEQSRFLQEVLKKMEKKQLGRVDAFLDSLNKTVLTELRGVRAQYDQVWQSTVLALEAQREQSQREVVALSSRLAVLADEVVFQKRMAILQSVLLLSCLVLVIFSRGGFASPHTGTTAGLDLAALQAQQQHRYFQRSASLSSPNLMDLGPGSPAASAAASPRRGPVSHMDADYSTSPSPFRSHPLLSRRFSASGRSQSLQQNRQLSTSPPEMMPSASYFSEKTLPLTPSSDFSRENTPGGPFFDDVAGLAISGQNTPTRELSLEPVDSTPPEANPVGGTASGSLAGQDELLASALPPMRRSMTAMSSQHGSGRKPLPALPEDIDVSEDAS
jgi:hypothetical protein